MNRVEHILFGTGTVVEPRMTESGSAAYLVRFDGSDTDRLILADRLKPSTSSAPDEPGETPKKGKKKAAPVKKTRRGKAKPISEEIPDTLLVEDLDESLPPRSEMEEYEEA